MDTVTAPVTCPACGSAAETGPFCRMCGAPLYTAEPEPGRAAGMAKTAAARIRERASYAFATVRARSAARSEVLAARTRLDRIDGEIRSRTTEIGEAVLRDDHEAVDALRGSVASLEAEAEQCREQIEQVVRRANGAVERERLAVQPTRIDRA